MFYYLVSSINVCVAISVIQTLKHMTNYSNFPHKFMHTIKKRCSKWLEIILYIDIFVNPNIKQLFCLTYPMHVILLFSLKL